MFVIEEALCQVAVAQRLWALGVWHTVWSSATKAFHIQADSIWKAAPTMCISFVLGADDSNARPTVATDVTKTALMKSAAIAWRWLSGIKSIAPSQIAAMHTVEAISAVERNVLSKCALEGGAFEAAAAAASGIPTRWRAEPDLAVGARDDEVFADAICTRAVGTR